MVVDRDALFVTLSEFTQRAERLNVELTEALASRVVIEQAKGILAEHNAISVDAAFELLRRHARSHRARLRDVADAVVQLGLRP
jgi:AmiR/NasT family two-component response regulator